MLTDSTESEEGQKHGGITVLYIHFFLDYSLQYLGKPLILFLKLQIH